MRPTSPYLWLGLLWLAALIGVGAFTFHYGEGLSYFSTNPEACANCHIMRPQLDSYRKSSHHAAATCVDCHLPRSFLSKYLAKAENGWNHSTAFTLQNFPSRSLLTKKTAASYSKTASRVTAPSSTKSSRTKPCAASIATARPATGNRSAWAVQSLTTSSLCLAKYPIKPSSFWP